MTNANSGAPRVAIVADPPHQLPGLDETIAQLLTRGTPGFDTELLVVSGAGAAPDPRLAAFDLIHLCGPGTTATTVLAAARTQRLPVTTSVHNAPADSDPDGSFHRACNAVLSPSRAADAMLRALGVAEKAILRWERGVDLTHLSPAHYNPDAMPAAGAGAAARINVLYAGRLSASKGVGLLADAFLLANARDPRLHLLLAGTGPEETALRHVLGNAATFLGWLDRDELARVLASADLFITASEHETVGTTVLEAQASGLPVLAVERGAVAELIASGRSGCLVEPTAVALGEAIRWLGRRATLRERLSTGGLLAVRARTWGNSLAQLAAAWSNVLVSGSVGRPPDEVVRAA